MVRFEHVGFPYEGKMCYGSIACEGDKIRDVDIKEEREDADSIVIPGFIDTHTHGFRGYGSEDDDLGRYLDSYPDRGVTSVCPTVGPRPLREYARLIDRYKKCGSPIFLGLHMEGPYLSPARHGAISVSSLYGIDVKELEEFLGMCKGGAAMMTIAPEAEHAREAARLLKKYGVRISFGHTDADYEEAAACARDGNAGITHMFNAMRPFSHKKAGIIDYVLKHKPPCELICDGNHVNPVTMEWFMEVMGHGNIRCVSDGGKTCGMAFPDGYELSPGTVINNGAVYENGVLAGSTKDVYDAFISLARVFRLPLPDCVRMTSSNAADYLGIPCGRIGKGYKADLLVMDCQYRIKEVYKNGARVR